jgi:hypothetical protein
MSSAKVTFADPSARRLTSGSRPHDRENDQNPSVKMRCFSIRAEIDPGLLPRLLEAFAKLGSWPTKFYSQVISADLPEAPAEAMIDIQIAGLDCATCDHIAMQFRGMVGVQSVLTSVRESDD